MNPLTDPIDPARLAAETTPAHTATIRALSGVTSGRTGLRERHAHALDRATRKVAGDTRMVGVTILRAIASNT